MKKVGSFLKGIWSVLRLVFGSKDAKLREYANATLKVIAVLRAIAENPLLDLITELSKTEIDDQLLKGFRVAVLQIESDLKSMNIENVNQYITIHREKKQDDSLPEWVAGMLMVNAAASNGIEINQKEALILIQQAQERANNNTVNSQS